MITVPPNQVIEAVNKIGAVATFSSAQVSDAVTPGVVVTCVSDPTGLSSGMVFPIGTTTFTCSSTDKAGNVGKKKFTITVKGRFFFFIKSHVIFQTRFRLWL